MTFLRLSIFKKLLEMAGAATSTDRIVIYINILLDHCSKVTE